MRGARQAIAVTIPPPVRWTRSGPPALPFEAPCCGRFPRTRPSPVSADSYQVAMPSMTHSGVAMAGKPKTGDRDPSKQPPNAVPAATVEVKDMRQFVKRSEVPSSRRSGRAGSCRQAAVRTGRCGSRETGSRNRWRHRYDR